MVSQRGLSSWLLDDRLHAVSSVSSGVSSSSLKGIDPILRSPLNLIILQRPHVQTPQSVRALTFEFSVQCGE